MVVMVMMLLLLLSAEMCGNFVIQVFDSSRRFDKSGHDCVCLFAWLFDSMMKTCGLILLV